MSIYVIPLIEVEGGHRDLKYRYTHLYGFGWGIRDHGAEPWCLCRTNLTPAAHAALVAEDDVWAFPDDLDSTVGAKAAMVSSKLAAVNMPGDWVNASTTWRLVVRRIAMYCTFHQEFEKLSRGEFGRLFAGGRTLATELGDLSVELRQKLVGVADLLGFDRSGIDGSTTIAAALKQIMHQHTKPIMLRREFL